MVKSSPSKLTEKRAKKGENNLKSLPSKSSVTVKKMEKSAKTLKKSGITKNISKITTAENGVKSQKIATLKKKTVSKDIEPPRVPKSEVKSVDSTNFSTENLEASSKSSKKILRLTEDSVITDEVLKNMGNLELKKSHVRKCVEALLTLAKQQGAEKKKLFDDGNPIFLQVNCIKIPKTARRQLRLSLPHTLVSPTDEVALFVPDLQKGLRTDYEKTVEHWETILRDKNVTRIKEIIPMNRVKTEFRQYEMRLKLGRMFDFFLVDGRITGHLTHLLGTTFRRRAAPPTPVKLGKDDLKSEIENALKKTAMEIHGVGDCHTVRVASTTMTESEIVDNIVGACEKLKKGYPGGWDNIRSVMVKTRNSLAIPVYFSIRNKNKVRVAKIPSKRPKAFKTVEGELSTVNTDVIARVEPGGKVILKKVKKEKS